eukprot:SAG22_NODE_1881_length_3377_cov_3.817322_2_plen_648_part_00
MRLHGGRVDASSGVDAQLRALEHYKGNSASILEKMERFKKSGAKKKQQSSMSKHKFAWMREMKQLQSERHTLERELHGLELPGGGGAGGGAGGSAGGGAGGEAVRADRLGLEDATAEAAERESISNGFQEIVALVNFTKVRRGEELRTMAAQCRQQIEAYRKQLRSGLSGLELEGDALEAEIAALRHAAMGGGAAAAASAAARPGGERAAEQEQEQVAGAHREVGDGARLAAGPRTAPLGRDRAVAGRGGRASLHPNAMLQLDGALADELAALDTHFIEQLEELRTQFEQELPEDVAHSSTGGWSKRAHEVFEKVLHEFSRAGELGREGQRRARFLERLRLELAAGGHDQVAGAGAVAVHADWHDQQRFYHTKRRAHLRRWRSEKRLKIEAGQQRLQQAAVDALAELQRQVEQANFQAARAELHERLAGLRAANDEQQSAAAAAAAERVQIELDEQRRAEKLWHEELEEKKKAIEEWRRKQAEEAAVLMAREEANKELALEQYRVLAEANAQRVAHRADEWGARQLAAAELLARQREEETARLDALDALAATVAPVVDRDPQRALMDTATTAPLTREDRDYFRLQDRKGRHAVTGYTSKQITNDRRTKLTSALMDAGLHKTQYGQAAIRAVEPTRNVTLHKSTFSFA